jgi:hypothetical protein
MRLSGVREGDIVRVNDGLSYLDVVRGRRGRRLLVAPLTGRWNPAPVKATDVIAHWRRTGSNQDHHHG